MQRIGTPTFLMAGFYAGGRVANSDIDAPIAAEAFSVLPSGGVSDACVKLMSHAAASASSESDGLARIGVYASAGGSPDGYLGQKVDKSGKLRVFLTSDYPLGLAEGEIPSDSAGRIKQLALELHNLGHKVVVMAPSYAPAPEITGDAPFPVRRVLFTPGAVRFTDFGRAAFGFDIPVLNRNPYLESNFLLQDMADEQVDRLVMGYLAMIRLTSLIFGDPNVVITSHATSLWNYAASAYPRFSMVSASDVIHRDMCPKLQNLIRVGAGSVHMFLALSELESRRLSAIVPGATLVKKLPFDVSLFGARSETGKRELLARYDDRLAGISENDRWVMLHDRSGHPDVLRYLVKVGSQLERDHPDVAAIIVSSHGDPKHVTREIEDRMSKRVRLIRPTKRGEVELLLSNGDATIIFNESGELSKAEHPMARELWIASRLAVILNGKDEGLAAMYFPGRVTKAEAGTKGYFGRHMRRAIEDFDGRSEEQYSAMRGDVRSELQRLKKNGSWTRVLLDEMGYVEERRSGRSDAAAQDGEGADGDTPRDRAIRQLRYSVLRGITADIARIAYSGEVPDGVARERTGVDVGAIEREVRRHRRWSLMTYLEDFLYKAANADAASSSGLEYREGSHRPRRAERLEAIRFSPDVREAFDDLVHDLRLGSGSLGDPFRRWQRKVLGALYGSSFLNPADGGAIPNPATNSNAVFSEIARLSGISTKGLLECLAEMLDRTPPEDRIASQVLQSAHSTVTHPCDCGKYKPLPGFPRDRDLGEDGTAPFSGAGGTVISLRGRRQSDEGR